MQKKRIICFGAKSFLAEGFIARYRETYEIIEVTRNTGAYIFDFENDDAQSFANSLPGNIDGLVFFQGIKPSVGLNQMTTDHFQRMMKVNVSVPAVLVRHLVGKMSKGCSVVFFSSVAHKKGSYDPSYASAKAAIYGLIQSLATACPEFRFNALALGLVEGSKVHREMTPDFVARHTSRMYDGKLIDNKDVSEMIAQLIDNQSLNRQEIFLDGGYI